MRKMCLAVICASLLHSPAPAQQPKDAGQRLPGNADRAVDIPCSLLGKLKVSAIPKHIAGRDPDFVFATGTWRISSANAQSELPKANSVDISCEKTSRTCSEAMALLWSKEETGGSDGFLDVLQFDYQVVEWSANLIRAVSNRPVADIELQISVPNQTATRVHRERADKTRKPITHSCTLE